MISFRKAKCLAKSSVPKSVKKLNFYPIRRANCAVPAFMLLRPVPTLRGVRGYNIHVWCKCLIFFSIFEKFNIGQITSYFKSGNAAEVSKPLDAAPFLKGNRTFLPIRFVVEPLGGTITWNQDDQKVTITKGTTTIELWIGNNVAKINGKQVQIDAANPDVKPMIVNPGRTMLPLRFISEALGCTVEWDQLTYQVTVKN